MKNLQKQATQCKQNIRKLICATAWSFFRRPLQGTLNILLILFTATLVSAQITSTDGAYAHSPAAVSPILTVRRADSRAQSSTTQDSLTGTTVTVGIYAPTDTDLATNTVSAVVGQSTPTFPVGSLFTNAGGVLVIPVSINVTGSAIEFDYSANLRALTATFNGYEFSFKDAPAITAVSVDQSSTFKPTGIAFTASTISVNVEGIGISVSDKLKLDITFAQSGLQFVPVTPCRIADTRNPQGPFGAPKLLAQTSREFDVPQSACSIPNTAVAYSLNVTVVPDSTLAYLTMWPSGQAQPTVSTLNSDGRVKANAAIVPAGTNGGVTLFATDPTQVILDMNGYFVPAGTSSALAFYPLAPCRLVDTRNSPGPLGGPSLGAGGSRDFPLQAGNCQLPSDAAAYSLNVTAIPKTTLHYLTMWPSGQAQPLVSTLNAATGTVTANAAILPAGTAGDVSVYTYDAADVVIDVNGYFAAPSATGLFLHVATPCRVLDTRLNGGAFAGIAAVPVESSECAVDSAAQAYVLNATVVPPAGLSYLTLWPAGETQPVVSTLNATDGAITSNMAIVPTLNGALEAYSADATQLILDISSYFAP